MCLALPQGCGVSSNWVETILPPNQLWGCDVIIVQLFLPSSCVVFMLDENLSWHIGHKAGKLSLPSGKVGFTS